MFDILIKYSAQVLEEEYEFIESYTHNYLELKTKVSSLLNKTDGPDRMLDTSFLMT